MNNCKACKWWKEREAVAGEGHCRRFPPIGNYVEDVYEDAEGGYTRVSGVSRPIWPVVSAGDWCGEFAAQKGGGRGE